MFNIVLVEPEIHWNTGNAGRTCLAAGARLHLVEPLGFSLDEIRLIGRMALAQVVDEDQRELEYCHPHLVGDDERRERIRCDRGITTSQPFFCNTFAVAKFVLSSHLYVHNGALRMIDHASARGVGTIILLFYNGSILGAVCFDYIAAGDGRSTAEIAAHASLSTRATQHVRRTARPCRGHREPSRA